MVDGKCSKTTEKCTLKRLHSGLKEDTLLTEAATTALVKSRVVRNEWAVPHNPYLVLKYNVHIKMKVFSTIKIVTYLYKYVYKSHNSITFHKGAFRRRDSLRFTCRIEVIESFNWLCIWRECTILSLKMTNRGNKWNGRITEKPH